MSRSEEERLEPHITKVELVVHWSDNPGDHKVTVDADGWVNTGLGASSPRYGEVYELLEYIQSGIKVSQGTADV